MARADHEVHFGVRVPRSLKKLIETAALMGDESSSEFAREELRKAAIRRISGEDKRREEVASS